MIHKKSESPVPPDLLQLQKHEGGKPPNAADLDSGPNAHACSKMDPPPYPAYGGRSRSERGISQGR
ncbi:hypothetical protein ELH44_37110 [Rhizobium ruizarguesonis]|uniref:hypothetical protein n=1 Tax=Rhizobium ruizarguesonis TaxID=2081791 RepID=UPI00103050C0|nr:hypothetical protein [Rhizobium ruizarguesonis]TBB38569.1 hypothetical protein ELH44_37110 [Rhizobium ruizarguesonis]